MCLIYFILALRSILLLSSLAHICISIASDKKLYKKWKEKKNRNVDYAFYCFRAVWCWLCLIALRRSSSLYLSLTSRSCLWNTTCLSWKYLGLCTFFFTYNSFYGERKSLNYTKNSLYINALALVYLIYSLNWEKGLEIELFSNVESINRFYIYFYFIFMDFI